MKEKFSPDPVYRGRLLEISGFHDKREGKENKKNLKETSTKVHPYLVRPVLSLYEINFA